MEKKIIYSLREIDTIVEYLAKQLAFCKVMTFQGPLGAGKTTLIRALLRYSGINEVITSPTFTYLNVYKNGRGQTFYHFDLYRIEKLEDFLSAGFDEYLYLPNSWVLIEWPAVIMPLLTHDVCHLSIDYLDEKRVLELK